MSAPTPEDVARELTQTAYGPKRLYGLQPNGRFAGEVFEERVLAALRAARAAAIEEAARAAYTFSSQAGAAVTALLERPR